MFHKVRAVSPQPDFRLLVEFAGGETSLYDVRPLFTRWPAFHALQQVTGLFEQVQVDAGGYGISWNDELDLSGNELWENGIFSSSEKASHAGMN